MNLKRSIQVLLNYIETKETELLSWGFVEGGLSETNLELFIEEWIGLTGSNFTVDELLSDLYKEGLMYEIHGRKGLIWRSRMAETIRLMARLRQWRHYHKEKWHLAPTLVSDFRLSVKERKYPKRKFTSEQTVSQLKEYLTTQEQEAIQCMLDRGTDFKLSQFQVLSSRQLFTDSKEDRSKGMIVCAGTGTGKTLSFYLPAFTKIGALISKSEPTYISAIALYPRNELLKDQFSDAYKEARRLDAWLQSKGKRKLRIAAIFGATPKTISDVPQKWESYQKSGYICPFMPCPTCGEALYWRTQDIQNEIAKLLCTSCQSVLSEDEVILTREQAVKTPPDILFTTTEMLNRFLSNVKFGRLIGAFNGKPPKWVLLDEVHTYTGTHGAHVALLLRRWQHAIQTNLHFTGLSATLEEAGQFFGQLTGLKKSNIEWIQANQGEMETTGHEYQLVLRGDPSSITSTLSTSIQTTMLMRRMLEGVIKTPHYGRKVFVFTDDLDVTNRLYHNLLDAEGRFPNGREMNDPPLAAYRASANSDLSNRVREGQAWTFAERLGHDLERKLIIGRTSSQDIGVSSEAEVVVATASLEVGYNDKAVGAVIQHKAPLDMAAYLQRKGRAGRDPNMRPWMITVLSDYGRDRFTYQNYESLFDPILTKKELPVQNRYILRMQVVFSTLDWFTSMIQPTSSYRISIWDTCTRPTTSEPFMTTRFQLVTLIEKVLTHDPTRKRLENHLLSALHLDKEQLMAILWDPPRSLMMNVLPTLLRRLDSNWGRVDGKQEVITANSPLPEFVPQNLFSELTLPEVQIHAPKRREEREVNQPPSLSITQAMNTFVPGRVTRRFGVNRSDESHWVAPTTLEPTNSIEPIEIKTFCTVYDEIGEVSFREYGEEITIPLIRPWRYDTQLIPGNISPTSNGFLKWRTNIAPQTFNVNLNGVTMELPSGSSWSTLIEEISFYTHLNQQPVIVKRFASDGEHTLKFVTNESYEKKTQYYIAEQRVALGFEHEVDGIAFRFHIPTSIIEENDSNQDKLRSYRVAYYTYRVMHDEELRGIANVFQLERLAELYISSLVTTSLINQCNLQTARELIAKHPLPKIMNRVLSVVFEVQSTSDIEEDNQGDYQRLHQQLLELSEHEIINKRLYELSEVLWGTPDEGWKIWAVERWNMTLGAAILQACKELSGSAQNDDIVFDLDPSCDTGSGNSVIWITELTGGGAGIIEEVMRRYQEDPRRFFRLVESALGPSDLEIANTEMSRSVTLAVRDEQVELAFEQVRSAVDHAEAKLALKTMQQCLREKGVLVTKPVLNSLLNRVLKPGSSPLTDGLLHQVISIWDYEEERLGIELDARVVAYALSQDSVYRDKLLHALSQIDSETVQNSHFCFQVLYSLMWPRGNAIRTRALLAYNPFAPRVPMDRELVRDTLPIQESLILSGEQWKETIQETLVRQGHVRLAINIEHLHRLRQVILSLASEPIDIGFLNVYPRIEGIRREGNYYVVSIDIREAIA
ncbi:DEAD/DEAH box helicase [Paenibacillus sp. PR3]|uniref:DEAD/DEAH box helicase n=1 Tax=Paenibacillus terricola TaxID=2763503 RepID=A0ABR8N2H1_9BACL|nr:protein DpdJ [Paenibacillus terricola]MBD3920999.1 DEAD/DEAH box helicase [Paenibacillus terricola]